MSVLLLAAALAGQTVTSVRALPDTDRDGRITLQASAAKVVPPVPKGTVVVPCGRSAALYVYAVGACSVAASPTVSPPPTSVPLAPMPHGAAATPLLGVNLSGAEFKGVESGALIPKASTVQAYYSAGFRLFRLPIRASQFSSPGAAAKIRAAVQKSVDLGVPIIIDRHEYRWPAVEEQVAFWTKVKSLLPDSPLVQFDLMNEPKGFNDPVLTNDREQWARDSRLIVHGLRAAGVTNFVWLEFPGWSGIYRFKPTVPEKRDRECLTAACGLLRQGNINDPLRATGIQGHRYMDKDGSGTSGYCDPAKTTSGFTRFAGYVAEWGMPAMIGESAFGKTAGCKPLLAATMAELAAPVPNLYGVTWWGGGAAWPISYIFSTPAAGDSRTAVLAGK